MRRPVLCIASCLLLAPTLAFGQSQIPGTAARVTGTVTANAPIYVSAPPAATLGPIRTAAVGTVLIVIGEKADWWQVEFNDPQYGPRVGWVQKKLLNVENPALKPMDLSVSPQQVKPPVQNPATAPVQQQAVAPASPAGAASAPIEESSALVPRRGFTMLMNLGIGIQSAYGQEPTGGLAGLNLGLGGFVNEQVAVLGRISTNTVPYDFGFYDELLVSGVVGATVQYWATDRFTVEGGAGIGFSTVLSDFGIGAEETGFGLILGASGVVFKKGKHNLLVGGEYAPVFTESGSAHNFGITFGYQFHR